MISHYNEPVYIIGIASKMLQVCSATLRIWEKKSLIKPRRIGKNRFYSQCEIDRLKEIKDLLQKEHVNIQGVKNILSIKHCWELKKCKEREKRVCPVYAKYGDNR